MGHQTVPLITQIHPIYIGFHGFRTNGMAVAAQKLTQISAEICVPLLLVYAPIKYKDLVSQL